MLRPAPVVVLAVSLLLVLAVAACAQPPEPPGPVAEQGQAQGQQAGGRGARGQDAVARMEAYRMMQQPPAATMVVADGFVYVVFGGTLFQFQVDGLKLVAQTQLMQLLPRQTPPGAPMQPATGAAPTGAAATTVAPTMPGMPGPK
jgi:hypothetical protein